MATVLFVCTGNAARSQMAEGWLKNLKPDFTVLSAGTKPDGLSPQAVKVMREVDLNISDQSSKHLDKVDWTGADYAITRGAFRGQNHSFFPEFCLGHVLLNQVLLQLYSVLSL